MRSYRWFEPREVPHEVVPARADDESVAVGTVARASGNAILAEVIGNLLDREERLNHLAHMLHDRNEDAYHEHHELVEALVAGDGARAEQVMADQIRAARAFVIEALLSSPSVQSVNVLRPASVAAARHRQPGLGGVIVSGGR